MAEGCGADLLPLLSGHVPPGFARRVVVIPEGPGRLFDEREWRDALVVVALGVLELECRDGSRCRFEGGAVLSLEGIPLRALHGCGTGPAVLVATTRTGQHR